MTRRPEDGSAVVEFIVLVVLLLVPLVYVVLAASSVQRAAFAVSQAAREAARAYATAASDSIGEERAREAARLAMSDEGVTWQPSGRLVSCGTCSYAPGSAFSVDVRTVVTLPFVPRWLCSERCIAGITVRAHHRERLDCYAGAGVTDASGAPC